MTYTFPTVKRLAFKAVHLILSGELPFTVRCFFTVEQLYLMQGNRLHPFSALFSASKCNGEPPEHTTTATFPKMKISQTDMKLSV